MAKTIEGESKEVRFTRMLRRLVDPALCCYWNRFKQRWVIDRCTAPDASSGLHTCSLSCRKTNVMVVETPDGQYRDLGDDLVGALKAMDCWANYGTIEGMNAAEARMESDAQASLDSAIDSTWAELVKDNAPQLKQALSLIKTHDMSEVH